LQLDGKNRAMLRSFQLVPGLYPETAFLLQPPFAQQRLHPLLPGRYVQPTDNMKHTLTSVLIILLIHISCTNWKGQEQDLSRVFFNLLDSSNYTSIDFRKLPNKNWDKMIVLTPYMNPQILKDSFMIKNTREIKRTQIEHRDDISLILFIQDNSIIDYFTCPRTLDFSMINQLTGHKFKDSKFMIEKTETKTISGEQVYILK